MRILFLVGTYYPKPTANSICFINIRNALLSMGIVSDVIGRGETYGKVETDECGKVYSVKCPIKYEMNRKNIFLFYLKKSRLLFTWPVIYPFQLIKYRKLARELMKKNNYDAVISDGYPIELPLTAACFKNSIIYELDSSTNSPPYEIGVKKLFKHRVIILEKLIYKKAAHIFHLRTNEAYYRQKKYDKFSCKSSYVDIPCIRKLNYSVSNENTSQRITCVYAGALTLPYRSPTYLSDLIVRLSEHIDIQCDFYSRGDCENIVKKYSSEYPNIINQMGYVSQDEIDAVIGKSDFLLSIGNKLSGQDRAIPSKVIGYIATGKPIIHIDGGDNDSAKDYLNRYGLALIVDPQKQMEDNVKDVLKFIENNRGKNIDFDIIKDSFFENTPEYSAKCIVDVINKINGIGQAAVE